MFLLLRTLFSQTLYNVMSIDAARFSRLFCLYFMSPILCVSAAVNSSSASPTLRLCTGSPTGHYYGVGQIIAQALSADLNIELFSTRGSWENLGRIHGDPPQCDAIIAQDDAVAVYLFEHPQKIGEIERVSPLYQEHIQVVCNRFVKARRLADLDTDTRIMIGSYGTGTFITWTLIERLVPGKYGVLRSQEIGGNKGISQLLQSARPQCLLFVQALAQGGLTRVNDELGEQLHLLHVDDEAFQYPINQGGISRVLYQAVHVHRNVYPKLLKTHLRTQTVDAVLYLHHSWRKSHPKLAELLSRMIISMQSRIQRSVD